MKTTRFALAAAASFFAISAASAADLGGNCCADLEERIAELEATTVRKGTRKMSVTLSGFVAHNILVWDDGIREDMYIGDGGNYGSRFRFRGDAKIRSDLTAGFLYEFGIRNNDIAAMNQGNFGDDLGGSGNIGARSGDSNLFPALRDSTVWLRHDRLGMVKIGHGSTATDNLILIDLGGMGGASTADVGLYDGGFFIRNGAGGFGATWAPTIRGHESWDTNRRNHVLYETPTFFGFSWQTAVAEDNYWDTALRFANEWNGVRVAFGIGYQEDTEFNLPFDPTIAAGTPGSSMDCSTALTCNRKSREVKGSGSILHVPTGLFLTGAAGRREVTAADLIGGGPNVYDEDRDFWYLATGISRNFFGTGRTVLFGEFSEHHFDIRRIDLGVASTTGAITTQVWGVGVNQYIDAANLEIYVAYKNYSTNLLVGGLPSLDFQAFLTGAKISF